MEDKRITLKDLVALTPHSNEELPLRMRGFHATEKSHFKGEVEIIRYSIVTDNDEVVGTLIVDQFKEQETFFYDMEKPGYFSF